MPNDTITCKSILNSIYDLKYVCREYFLFVYILHRKLLFLKEHNIVLDNSI
jgi:hypothetical protein